MTAGFRHSGAVTEALALPANRPHVGALVLRCFGSPLAYPLGTVLLSALGMGTMLIAPRLMSPATFGNFSLLTILFQYAAKSDLGLSQLADREIALNAHAAHGERASQILRARWMIWFVGIAVATPVVVGLAFITRRLPASDTALALGAGATAMASVGPLTLYRASSQISKFTALALALQAGVTAPRLLGLTFGGITGCFATLLCWYLVFAMRFARPSQRGEPLNVSDLAGLLRQSLPLFAFNGAWLLYLTANRWIAAWLSPPDEFGLFAFGANLAFVGVAILGTISQVRYPKLLAHTRRAPVAARSALMERELHGIGAALSVAAALGILACGRVIGVVFPGYGDATGLCMALAVSCVPLGTVAWIMPALIALSPRPRRDAIAIFGPALALLIAAMAAGNIIGGRTATPVSGQAWACVFATLALCAIVAALMRRRRLLDRNAALRVLLAQSLMVLALMGIATAARASGHEVLARDAPVETVPPPGWALQFEDDFKELRIWTRQEARGIWDARYPWGARTNAANRELEYYVDPRPGQDRQELQDLHPYEIRDGQLAIVARPIPDGDRAFSAGLGFASGLLTSARTRTFTYGYFEICAQVPKGQGLWPAFWLIPADRTWPPEIDVFEVLGHRTEEYWVTAHSAAGGRPVEAQTLVKTPDLSAGFHRYAVKWMPDQIEWYFDGHRVAATPTPADMHKPMYLVVNLAVGGKWPGPPDASTRFPARLTIAGIRVFGPPPDP